MEPAASLNNPSNDRPATHESQVVVDRYTRNRSKSILLLATLVATATYAAGFNPPGGVWQDTRDPAGNLPGDPIIRSTDKIHYLVFFYANANATAFASSVVVVVLTLLLTACHKDSGLVNVIDLPLQILMLAAMLAFTAAYVAGSCRQKLTLIYFCVLIVYAFLSGVSQVMWHLMFDNNPELLLRGVLARLRLPVSVSGDNNLRKIMVPLSMFAVTITYVAGLSTPGGFWDSAGDGHRPGDPILKDHREGKVSTFVSLNTMAFVASLYGVFVVMCRKSVGSAALIYISFGLYGLVGAYISGSSRGRLNTVNVLCGLYAAVVAYIVLHVAVVGIVMKAMQGTWLWQRFAGLFAHASRFLAVKPATVTQAQDASDREESGVTQEILYENKEARERRRAASLVQLLAGLAVGITYQAGLYPPGGIWQDDADWHMAGDPILRTTNTRRYTAFYYCNSVSFVASLLAILLGQTSFLHEHHALQAAMILDLLGLIAAYAIGSCRDQVSTMYALGLAGAAVVYVFVHVSYFTLGDTGENKDDALVEKMGGLFLLFAILVASITYQAGLTPPGGFLLQDDPRSGHHAGDPILLYNYPRRYRAFFYCNSVSFMISIVLILLLVNPTHYKPAIRSHALSICSAVSFICLMGSFASGSTQHMKGSHYIFVLAAVAFFFICLLLLLVICCEGMKQDEPKDKPMPRPSTAKRIYLTTLGILVASVTYQAGLDQPGGSWQSNIGGHDAGNPVMHDYRRDRYFTFFYANSTSFFASINLILLLLFGMVWRRKWCTMAIRATVVPQCLGLLLAYDSGSSRQWATSVHVGALVVPVLAYVAAHVMLSVWRRRSRGGAQELSAAQQPVQTSSLQLALQVVI